jgi:hypothetical protein
MTKWLASLGRYSSLRYRFGTALGVKKYSTLWRGQVSLPVKRCMRRKPVASQCATCYMSGVIWLRRGHQYRILYPIGLLCYQSAIEVSHSRLEIRSTEWCANVLYTVFRFVSVSAQFGTVLSVKGTLLKLKCAHSPLSVRIISSTSVPFTLMTVHMPNLALVETKRITVCSSANRLNGLWSTEPGKML